MIKPSKTLHTQREITAYAAIKYAMITIQRLEEEGLKYNDDELAQAIHVLQSFVKQHVLWRQDPLYYSDWWSD